MRLDSAQWKAPPRVPHSRQRKAYNSMRHLVSMMETPTARLKAGAKGLLLERHLEMTLGQRLDLTMVQNWAELTGLEKVVPKWTEHRWVDSASMDDSTRWACSSVNLMEAPRALYSDL